MNKKMKKVQEVKPEVKKVEKTADDKSLRDQIKDMEQKKRSEVKPEATTSVVSFDSWYHLRKNSIPRHHVKEIIWTYFKSRGLSETESVKKYDEELKRYGIKI